MDQYYMKSAAASANAVYTGGAALGAAGGIQTEGVKIPALERLSNELADLCGQAAVIEQNLRAFLDRAGGPFFSDISEKNTTAAPTPTPSHAFGRIEEYLHSIKINMNRIGDKVSKLNHIA